MAFRVSTHIPKAHRNAPVKTYCRVATTANITIATALNSGDSLDGITLATDDRVLVKDQSAGAQNGIYVVAASPARAEDMDDAAEVLGTLVYVIAGTANGGKLYRNTNTTAVTLETTALTFAEVGGVTGFATPAIVLGTAAAAGAATTVIRSDSTIVAFDATVPAAIGTAATGAAAVAARRDHVHNIAETTVRDIGHWEVVVSGTAPPVAVSNPADDDWVWAWVAD